MICADMDDRGRPEVGGDKDDDDDNTVSSSVEEVERSKKNKLDRTKLRRQQRQLYNDIKFTSPADVGKLRDENNLLWTKVKQLPTNTGAVESVLDSKNVEIIARKYRDQAETMLTVSTA